MTTLLTNVYLSLTLQTPRERPKLFPYRHSLANIILNNNMNNEQRRHFSFSKNLRLKHYEIYNGLALQLLDITNDNVR